MKIDPKSLNSSERYRLMGSIVIPRPIALVSTVSTNGVLNLAPFALFNLICLDPVPMVFFTLVRRRGVSKKDTLVNIEQNKEFVINMVTEEIAQKMNVAGIDYPQEVDEFHTAELTPVSSDLVKVPRVAESPINMECCLTQIVEFGKTDITGEMVVGEVIRVHVRDVFYTNGVIDAASIHIIGRMGWGLYTRTRDLFEIREEDRYE
jgi:flavin reductase (DIM6/NTAB) family NADH-FMN oxidoreductase RutF